MATDWSWLPDLLKNEGKTTIAAVVSAIGGAVGKGLLDRKKNREAAKVKEGLRSLVAENEAVYRSLAEGSKTTPEGAKKRFAEAGMLNRAEMLREAYKSLGDDVESIRWGTIAKDLETTADHQPLIDEESRRHEEAIRKRLTEGLSMFAFWQKAAGEARHVNTMEGEKVDAAEAAAKYAAKVAKAYRDLSEEGNARTWESTAQEYKAMVAPVEEGPTVPYDVKLARFLKDK